MRRTPSRRLEENKVQEEIPPHVENFEQVPKGDQLPIVGEGNEDPPKLTNRDIREAFIFIARVVTTQVNLSLVPRGNVVERTMTSRLGVFLRMNPPIFLGSKVREDLQEFFDSDYMVLRAIGVTSREMAELASYQLWDISYVL